MAKASFFAPTSMVGVFQPEQNFHENAHVSWLTLVGRRRDDATLAQVRADLSVVASRIDQQQPGRTTSLIVEPAAALSLPVARRMVLRGASIVMAAFGLVLLIAAANVANMLLARAAARTREIAIRLSVGATRGRLIQQLLTESAVIALGGALCGALLAWWSFQALVPWLLASVPGAEAARIDVTPDRTVLWFALGLTAATALVFGLVPALQASKGDVHAMMKHSGANAKGGRSWLRGTLIAVQIALCTMLLIPAGLLARALYAAHTFEPGFDYRNVAVVSIDLRGPRYEKGNGAAFHEQWLERVRALPGVESVAQASRVPLSPGRSQATVRIGDEPEGSVVDVNTVTPDFFPLLGIPIVRGRPFVDDDVDTVLVHESTARRYWPGQDPSRPHRLHGRPAAPRRGGCPRRPGLTGSGRDLELHVFTRVAGSAARDQRSCPHAWGLRCIRGSAPGRDGSHGRRAARERAAAVEQCGLAADAVADRGGRRRHPESARRTCSRR